MEKEENVLSFKVKIFTTGKSMTCDFFQKKIFEFEDSTYEPTIQERISLLLEEAYNIILSTQVPLLKIIDIQIIDLATNDHFSLASGVLVKKQ